MSKAIVKQSIPVEERVKTVKRYQDSMSISLSQWAAFGALAGFEMIAIKTSLPHGEWEDFFNKELKRPKFSLRTAQVCMAVAEGCKGKMLKNADSSFLKILDQAPSQFDAKSTKVIEAEVKKIVDGKTFTQVAQEFGIVKKPRGGNNNPSNTGNDEEPVKKSPEQVLRDITDNTRNWAEEQLGHDTFKKKLWRTLDDNEIKALVAHYEEHIEQMAAWIKTPKANRAKIALKDFAV